METIKINIGGVITEMNKEDASKAIEAGELSINNENLVAYTKEDFDKFKTNLANSEYKNGKIKGNEMLIKETRDELGLEFEGKNITNLLDSYKNSILKEASVEPSKKIKEYEEKFNSLQTNYKELESNFETYKNQITEKETRLKKDNAILNLITDDVLVDKDIALMALKNKSGLDVDFRDGKTIRLINGQSEQNKTLDDLELTTDFITEQLTSLNLIKKEKSGRGSGDELGDPKASDYEKFVKEMNDKEISEGSEKFQLELNKRIGEKTIKL